MVTPPGTSSTRPHADELDRRAVDLHRAHSGKLQVAPRCPIHGFHDYGTWYTPGVAAASRAIAADPDEVFALTDKWNSVAIVTDGTRVMGLGDVGPEAALPVMEGKALLFKVLGGVDAVPICLDTQDADEIVRTVELVQPAFGGINLEDMAQPRCFTVLARARERCRIPVWHDDQQGTAACVLAALDNALAVVGKDRRNVRVALVGTGAANVASYHLLVASGLSPDAFIACDARGTLHRGRHDVEAVAQQYVDKWLLCTRTNPTQVHGGVADALRGADVCIAFSRQGPGVIDPAWVRNMAGDAIVFACANPAPEILPIAASDAGARVVATSLGDAPNQLNSALVFPGLVRGVLDARARTVTTGMVTAAAEALAGFARRGGLRPDHILPRMDEPGLAVELAVATAVAAMEEGVAGVTRTTEELRARATRIIASAQELTRQVTDQVDSGAG